MKIFSQSLPPSLKGHQKFEVPSFSGELLPSKICFCCPYLSCVADQYCTQGHIASVLTYHESLGHSFQSCSQPYFTPVDYFCVWEQLWLAAFVLWINVIGWHYSKALESPFAPGCLPIWNSQNSFLTFFFQSLG